jgi:hypothetical protein
VAGGKQAQFDFAPVEPAACDHASEAIGAGVEGRVAFSLGFGGNARGAALKRRTRPGCLACTAALRAKTEAAGAAVRLALRVRSDQHLKPGRGFRDIEEAGRALPAPFRAVLAP